MISYIRGTLEEKNADSAVIDVGGMGFEIMMPTLDAAKLPAPGSEIKIYTYLNVREDAMQLFGFKSREALDMFKLLITVNSVGPKGALGILGELGSDGLVSAIVSEDEKAITKAPGIGAKTAKRIIIDLKDKLDLEDIYTGRLGGSAAEDEFASIRGEAAEVLAALGYSKSQAFKALDAIEINDEMTVDKVVSKALRTMSPL